MSSATNFISLFVVFFGLFAREDVKRINIVKNTLVLVAKWVPWKLQKLFAQEIDN